MKRKLLIIAYFSLAVFCGILVGNIIVGKANNKTDFSKYNESDIRDNEEKIYEDYKAGKISFSSLKSSDGAKAIIIALKKNEEKEYFKITAEGSVKASIATQTLYGMTEKNGNKYMTYEISNGLIKVANKMIYDTSTDVGELYKGKVNADGKSAEYNNAPKIYSNKSYKEEYGVRIDEYIHHIISTKTILEVQMKETSNGKQFIMKLDPTLSIINYAKQISKNSNMDIIKFNFVNFSFEIDDKFNLINSTVDEEYVVDYGFAVTCSANINATYSYVKGGNK